MASWGRPQGMGESVLKAPLLKPISPWHTSLSGGQAFTQAMSRLRTKVQLLLAPTADADFVRSEVSGRRSRRIVLLAFFCTDVIGALLWATWCQSLWGLSANSRSQGDAVAEQLRACASLGINHFVLMALALPIEGVVLFLAGRNPWSFWSDALLLPVWLLRLVVFDALVWSAPPQTLVVDALWFSVMAVMCRVHSLALAILVVSQVASLLAVFWWHGALILDDLDHVRYGVYSISALLIMAAAYALDEQSRARSFARFAPLRREDSALADRLLRRKLLPRDPRPEAGDPRCGGGRSIHMSNAAPATAADAWKCVATPLKPILKAGRAPADEAALSDLSEQSTADLEAAEEPRAPPQRRVRFSLPRGPERRGAPTQRPSADFVLSPGPRGAVDLLDVME
uniref:Uncharacterized protein n=1 Tax=Alexandrium catenella TaxID=2925 RepID=A0A7S1WTV9_ALECA|mmetsp:Transcript_90030/g.239200  ORF Transcript_90030/g.239200 Transcript_90030/m.239200 type:complete len:399 (+) Transcript_90030:54-1250(+)